MHDVTWIHARPRYCLKLWVHSSREKSRCQLPTVTIQSIPIGSYSIAFRHVSIVPQHMSIVTHYVICMLIDPGTMCNFSDRDLSLLVFVYVQSVYV